MGDRLKDANSARVIHYGRYDWAAGASKNRIEKVLPALADNRISSVNDAIEAYQAKLTVEDIPELFEPDKLPALRKNAGQAFGNACRYVNTRLSSIGISQLYDQVERQYAEQFWKLLGLCNAEKRINGDELVALLTGHPYCMSHVLEMPTFVKRFDYYIKDALARVPFTSAKLIIRSLAMDSRGQRSVSLPSSLTNSDVDSIMLAYLDCEHPNPNYVEVLTRWPNRIVDAYRPSPEVCVKARRIYDKISQEQFEVSSSLRFSTGVVIDMSQHACRGISVDGLDLTLSFSGQWLEAYMDPATIMNNCRWLFDFMNPKGLLQMPAHEHEERGLVALLGPRVHGEYRDNPTAQRRQSIACIEAQAYADFLERHDKSLEEVLEWVYGTYFHEEFGIDGFGISLPSRDGTWLDRCKGIGSEIERAMKEYQLYAKYGIIEDEYFPYERFKSFGDAPALAKNKYAVADGEFLPWAWPLLSDQSLLAYADGKEGSNPSFYSLMLSTDITRADYQEPFRRDIEQLIEKGLVEEDSVTGKLVPTQIATCLGMVWDSGAVVARYYGGKAREDIDELVSQGLLKYHDGLFTPDEASFLNYIFNDSEQTNAIGLRNKYSHANGVISDPNSDEIRSDYYMMLTLLISITLKINDELVDAKGRPGGIEFVDWAFYDKSVFKSAKRLTDKRRHESMD